MSNTRINHAKQFFEASFPVYLAAVIYLLFFSRANTPLSLWTFICRLDPDSITSVNLVPFGTISCYLMCLTPGNAYADVALCNLLGNFLLFLPMGFYLPLISGRSYGEGHFFPSFLLRIFLTTLTVETIQLFTGLGCFDVDDMILNMAGAVTGYVLCGDVAAGFSGTAALGFPCALHFSAGRDD